MVELKRRSEMKLLETAQYFFDEAAERLGLENSLRELLRYPKLQLIVTFPVVLDNGTTRHFVGYRVQHHPVFGPCKGGIRFHPDVSLEEVQALAILMTWKAGIIGLPFSGAKGGVCCNPKSLSQDEFERLVRRFAAEIAPLIGPEQDIPGPDLHANEREMAWIVDTISMHHKAQFMPGLVTGKPPILGGSAGRESATGRGGFFCAVEALNKLAIPIERARFVIQGFGNVGWNFARFARDAGARVIGVSDSQTGLYNPEGLNLARLHQHKLETGSLVGFSEAESISNSDLLQLSCEVLAPAAVEHQITEENVGRIQAKIIIEMANGPTTLEADHLLYERDVLLVPDILANAGGVTVSYLEWTQDRSFYFWDAARIDHNLRIFMTQAFEKTWQAHLAEGVNMRTAAYLVALERVAAAARRRGLYA
jgi:glutamate dehydrogenase (NAD(P)+)